MCRMALLCWESFQQNRCLQEAFSECFRVSRGVLGAGVPMAADSRNPGKWCLLERLEGLVRLERLGQCLRALGINAVAGEAASESRPQVSGAADTCVSVTCGAKRAGGGVLERLER